MKTWRILILSVGLAGLLAGTALAHKVTLFAYVEGGKVLVYDSQEKLLLEGLTDKAGLFSFAIPKVDDLTIVLDATMGHKNSFKLKKAEVEAGK